MSRFQYTQIAGPLTTDQPLETTSGWQRQQPEPTRRTGIITALTVAACILPATFAQGSADAPTDWRPTYPHKIEVKTLPQSHGPWLSTQGPINPIPPPIDTGRFIALGSYRVLQYQGYAAPFFVPPPELSERGNYPDKVYPLTRLHASLHQVTGQDKFTAPTAVTVPDNSWDSQYPASISPRNGLRHYLQQVVVTDIRIDTLAPEPSPDLAWKSIFPDRHSYHRSLAPYVKAHEDFPVIIRVPVMSWTGVYLDPPTRRKSPHAAQQAGMSPIFEQLLVATAAAPLSWDPKYPSKIDKRIYSVATLTAKTVWNEYLADTTTTAPALSWDPTYADFAPAARRLFAGSQPAFWMDRFAAPDPVTAPDLAVPVYVDIVHGRRPNVDPRQFVTPIYLTDITTPAPLLSWLARYPDYIIRLEMAAAQNQDHFEPQFVPGSTVLAPTLAWQGEYPDYIWRRRILHPSANPAFTMDAKWEAPPIIIVSDIFGNVYIVRFLTADVKASLSLDGDVKVD